MDTPSENNCPICSRQLGTSNVDKHHWIPKLDGGKEASHIHKICHQKIHSVFTERELTHYYHTADRIREHEQMRKFIKWVQKQPIDFYSSNKDTNQRKRKRKNR